MKAVRAQVYSGNDFRRFLQHNLSNFVNEADKVKGSRLKVQGVFLQLAPLTLHLAALTFNLEPLTLPPEV